MFTYFHCYMPNTWKAQEDCGLINEYAGVRFCQNVMIDENLKFNRLARRNGDLCKMIEERLYPVYIDRLQGGVFFEKYEFDKNLIEYYKNLLGDRFFGFQMHEWISNLSSDFTRISNCVTGEWNKQSIEQGIREKHRYPYVFLEAQSAEEYAQCEMPKNGSQYIQIAENLLKKRLNYCDNLLIPCDSYGLAFDWEVKHGVKRFMPEVGAQTPDTRLQIAYARGVARSKKAQFGVYYEPWGGEPFSACCYHRENKNEWAIGSVSDFPFVTLGENGGSSRSLQKRIHLYAYFAGADFISEEWGMCNTFYDWKNFGLTPYGQTKLDFLKIVKKYPQSQIGKQYTPCAIVLPSDLPVVIDIACENDDIWNYPISGEFARKTKIVRRGLKKLLSNSTPMIGDETAIIINSRIPDAFDVIHEDACNLSDYKFFVNLTGSESFEQNHKCVSVDEAAAIVKNHLHCEVDGNVHWFVNRTTDGWLLIILNNSGVRRCVAQGEYTLPQGNEAVTVTIKNGGHLERLEGAENFACENGKYHFTIKSGDWFLGKFKA